MYNFHNINIQSFVNPILTIVKLLSVKTVMFGNKNKFSNVLEYRLLL